MSWKVHLPMPTKPTRKSNRHPQPPAHLEDYQTQYTDFTYNAQPQSNNSNLASYVHHQHPNLLCFPPHWALPRPLTSSAMSPRNGPQCCRALDHEHVNLIFTLLAKYVQIQTYPYNQGKFKKQSEFSVIKLSLKRIKTCTLHENRFCTKTETQ